MNIFKKLLISTLLGGLVFGLSSAASASNLTATLPEIATLTAQVGRFIASELKAQLAQAVAVPRPSRTIRAASVVVTEADGMQTAASQASAKQRAESKLMRRVLEPRL